MERRIGWRLYLGSAVQESVTDSSVIYFKLINTVDIGNFEFGAENSISTTRQHGTNERIDPNKLQLDVFRVEWDPLVLFKFFNFDFIHLFQHKYYIVLSQDDAINFLPYFPWWCSIEENLSRQLYDAKLCQLWVHLPPWTPIWSMIR